MARLNKYPTVMTCTYSQAAHGKTGILSKDKDPFRPAAGRPAYVCIERDRKRACIDPIRLPRALSQTIILPLVFTVHDKTYAGGTSE